MPRPVKKRFVHHRPVCCTYGPMCKDEKDVEKVPLYADQLEALRLADLEGLSHDDAAKEMKVSRQTFGRIVEEARAVVTEAIINNKAFELCCGKNVQFIAKEVLCTECGNTWEHIPSDKKESEPVTCDKCGSTDIIKRTKCGTKCECDEHINQ